jgi:haloacetate dehalogenase
MFGGFQTFDIPTGAATIHGRIGGAGPPLLLLHGYPQTHAMWHRVGPILASRYTVVVADLRGYGRSTKPLTSPDHAPYSKRAMAADLVAVMAELGHRRFAVGAHDRGARVAHRMALDWEDRVSRLALLDIAPTREMYRDTTDRFARAYWHWFFLIQPEPLPEAMIAADPEAFWRRKCGLGPEGHGLFDPEALADYLACWTREAIHASCEDYRAAASIDLRHDDADGDRRVSQPLLALWGANGVIDACFDCLALWRERARDVRGEALPGGHYLAEEVPDMVAERFMSFLGADG